MTAERRHVEVDDADPRRRGLARGAQLRDELPGCLTTYLRLFETVGVPQAQARAAALELAEIVGDWRPDMLTEIAGVAEGAGLELWQLMALNGRTEILSQATASGPAECSTLVCAPVGATAFGVQTWDWHEELDRFWHTHRVAGTRYSYAGMTEQGVLSKIGVNSAGVAVHFNILSHLDDAPAGVPVHLLSAAVLAEAGSVSEAVELLQSAPIATSGALTIFGTGSAVCVELTPGRVTVIEPVNGFAPHTNHFLDPVNAEREKSWLYQPDSQQRLDLIAQRLGANPIPRRVDDLVDYLYSEPGQPLLCCVPAPEAQFGDRWATLATVLLEPEARRARVLAGSPADARRGAPWIALQADESLEVSR